MGLLRLPAVYWHHTDLQLRGRLQVEVRILLRKVQRLTLWSKANIYRQMKVGRLMMPLELAPRAVTRRADEIHEWFASDWRCVRDPVEVVGVGAEY